MEESNAHHTGMDWSESEVRVIVVDYFDMLENELMGREYNKSEHRKSLVPRLAGRSEGSVEFKHRNISGVLVQLGLPYIEGYRPLSNYQAILAGEVERFLDQRPEFLQGLSMSPALSPADPKWVEFPTLSDVIEDPPDRILARSGVSKPWHSRRPRRIDFVERDAANHRLGRLAEQFVVELETYRLNQAGRDDLARRVVWASRDIGDGLGFDVISFDESDDSERLLEVKATALGKYFPFYVTSNEVRCSQDVADQYQLFRVFDFGRSPRAFILRGSLAQHCQLDPVLYRAAI